jgi:hypothetical protein
MFAFQLQDPSPGSYAYALSIWSFDKNEMYDSTDWVLAFDISSRPVYWCDLGTLNANSYVQDNPIILHLRRFESISYTFSLANDVTDLSVKIFTVPDSEFRCALNASGVQMDLHGEILPHYNVWHNVPANAYEMNLEMKSAGANVIRVVLQAGQSIETPSVRIIEVESTSDFATPVGTMNYKIDVGFDVTTYDTLVLTATLSGQIQDTQTFAIAPFEPNEISTYLQVNAPPEIGQYSVDFNAFLQNLGISDPASAPLSVEYSTYNIVISPTVRCYQDRLRLSLFKWGHVYVDDSAKLAALDVRNIIISGIDKRDPQTQKPTMVSISFDAANKEGNVHYVVNVKIGTDSYQLGVVIGKDDPSKMEAHNIPVINDRISFTIFYNRWWFGNWVAEVGTKFAKGVVGFILPEIAPELAPVWCATGDLVQEIARCTMLYTAKLWVERENAYMTIDDATRILEYTGIQRGVFSVFLDAAVGVTRNSFYAFVAAVELLHNSGKISDLKWALAYIAALMHILGKAEARLPEIMSEAFVWSMLKLTGYAVVEEIARNEFNPLHGVFNPKTFLKNLGGVIDGVKTVLAAAKILLSPSEEGKEISDVQMGPAPIVEVDPLISISFRGQIDYTNETCFGDTLSMSVNFNQSRAQAILEVDSNLTAVYFALLSDSASRSDMFSSFGFNASQTNLDWRSEESTFVLDAIGAPYEGLIHLQFWMNSSYVQCTQTMSTEASQTADTAWLNGTLLYPFGKNLTYSINVTLPEDFRIMQILSNGTHTVEGNTITWNEPIDWLAIEFVSPHDIAINNVTTSKTALGQGRSVTINATVSNQGNVTETFHMLAYANSTLIQNQTITLSKGDSRQISFSWNTTGFVKGNYIMTFSVTELQDEIDTADNRIGNVAILVTILGDINGDEKVNSLDLSQLNAAYASTPQSSNWSPNADVDDDRIISVKDLWAIGENYGRNMTILGDINEDYIVNVEDLFILGKAYSSIPGSPNWNPNADLNNDLLVNVIDLEELQKKYGKTV